jgi:hypothetical protein
MLALMGNWSLTTWAANTAVAAAGGYTHSLLNCELDVDNYWGEGTWPAGHDPGDVLPGSSLAPCGLHKTNGRPRANNTADAAVWAAPERVGGGPDEPGWMPWNNTTENGQCAAFLRTACDPSSVFSKIPTMLAFNGTIEDSQYRGQTLYSDIARFLLVRGPFSWIGFGWEQCVNIPPPIEHFAKYDFGEPLELCHETHGGSGVFTRRWSKATITVDCGKSSDSGAVIDVVGSGVIPPVPPPPPSPPPPPPPPPPAKCGARCGRGGPCVPCRQCTDPKQRCPFPVPPLPPCPAGFSNHSSGYWKAPDAEADGTTIEACGAKCTAMGLACKGFEVYDTWSVTKQMQGGGCYTYSHGLQLPFTADARGLVRTCVRASNSK